LTSVLASSPRPKSAKHYSQVKDIANYIVNSLNEKEIELGERADSSGLIAEARDYYWVQFRDVLGDGWKDVHPAFVDELPFPNPEWTEIYTESVPKDLQHRIRFQVHIERKIGDQLESVAITDIWERPVANLFATPITFANISDTMMEEGPTALDLRGAVNGASFYVPAFLGGVAPGARYFDLNGNVIDPTVAGRAPAGVFEQIGRAFEDAARQVAEQESLTMLTAQWMEFTLIKPGGLEQTFKRTTFDLLGAHARETGNLSSEHSRPSPQEARSLLGRHTFMLHTGRVPKAYAASIGAERLLGMRGAFEAILRHQFDQPGMSSFGSGPTTELAADWHGHLPLFTFFDMAEELGDSHRVYRSAPALVIQSEGLAPSSGFSTSVDIVTNPRRALRVGRAELPVPDPFVLVQSGVWETVFEGLFLSGAEEVRNTFTAFDEAKLRNVPIVVVGSADELSGLAVSEDTKAAIRSDLEDGFVAMVPNREAAELSSGWWRVDPITGLTLGQYGDGRGATIGEYLLVGITFGFVAYGALNCAEAEAQGASDEASICCFAANVIFAVAGVILGALLAPAAVGPELAIIGITWDLGTGFIVGPGVTAICSAVVDYI